MDRDSLIAFGWEIAAATLAGADSERKLVAHWFRTAEDAADDDGVNADDHFGSNERTLRFLGVALPTLIDQLNASAAVVALPYDGEHGPQSLTVVAVSIGGSIGHETRSLTRLQAEPGPPFWRLEPGPVPAPAQLAATVSRLAV